MLFILGMVLVFALLVWLYVRREENEYKQTSYYKSTHNSRDKIEADKGLEGEYLIYKALADYEKDGAKLLFNCYIPKKDGTRTEIDALMLHRSGIYVIESKNYSGWIFGNEQDENWTQSLLGRDYEAHKKRFFNPVLQNKLHIKHLRQYLRAYKMKIYSIIVFSDRCELKSITINSSDIKVVHRQELQESISAYMTQNILPEAEITKMYYWLLPCTQLSEEEKQKHCQDVERTIERRELQRGKICPICGSTLVVRTVKKGAHAGRRFYGCAAYPRCRYTENADDVLLN